MLEIYGVMVMTQTVYLKDPDARKQARIKGREILLHAEKLGSNDPLVKSMLESVPADGGSDTTFSLTKEVNEAMREGEAAFAGGNFDKAIEMYQRALLFDPNLYEAALFMGDVYYKTADQAKAGEWFARAIAINPDRETAYRYWGDSLLKQGRVTDAGDKFVEAFIAEPYSRLARAGFLKWGEKVNVPLAHPPVEIPTSVNKKNDKETTIVLTPDLLKSDEKSRSSVAWVTYGLVRAGWPETEFSKAYPNEKKYRHSLKEEAEAIRAALRVLNEKKPASSESIDPSLQILAKLDKEGLLEAFILLALPDEGIASDYAAYRKTNLDNLRRYVKQYVMTGGGQN